MTWRGSEFEGMRKDGAVFPIELSISEMKLGNRQEFTGMVRDITRRKFTEEALSQAKEKLEQKVEQRTHELTVANDQLSQEQQRLTETLSELQSTQRQVIQQERLRALGQMASGIAHDLNNALVAVLGYSELLIERADLRSDTDKSMRYIRTIHTAAEDASTIVRRLRGFYRPRREESTVPVDLNEVVKQAILLTQPRWRDLALAKGITIEIQTDLQAIPRVAGIEPDIRHVVTNLIFNAADALQKSGEITIQTCMDGEAIVLEVADTGAGMTIETQAQCLEPFFTTKGDLGTGLGLAMVDGIMQRHGGAVEIQSELGKGSTFSLRFPARAELEEEERTRIVDDSTAPMHILVVDDQTHVLELMTEYLVADGHTVATATSGRECLKKFRAGSFDLVITDMAMPSMNGEQLAAAVKQLAPNTPVMLLTGFGEMMEEAQEQLASIDLVLSKPVVLRELQHSLAALSQIAVS